MNTTPLQLFRRSPAPSEADGQRGVAMVEFAIVLPLLLIILFGIVEFGLVLFNKQVITNASREGARYGIVATNGTQRVSQADIQGIVNDYCGGKLITFDDTSGNTSTPECPVDYPDGFDINAPFGQELTVRVQFDYTFLVLPALLPKDWETINLIATTAMRYE